MPGIIDALENAEVPDKDKKTLLEEVFLEALKVGSSSCDIHQCENEMLT